MTAAPVPNSVPRHVQLYVNGVDCPLCEDARFVLERLAGPLRLVVEEIPVDQDPALAVRYALRVPVVEVDGQELAFGRIEPAALEAAIRRVAGWSPPMQSPAGTVHSPPEARVTVSPTDSKPDPVPGPGSGSAAGTGTETGAKGANKLSEALGFGAAMPASPTIAIGPAGTREPKRAFAAPLPTESRGGAVGTAPTVAAAGAPVVGGSAEAASDMVEVGAGSFLYGEDRRRVEVPGFAMDRDPVTNADYERFVAATGHRPPLYWRTGRCPDELRDHPVVGVDVFDALAYARYVGKDLPFEDEWERAARGTDGRTFPWGDEPDLAANTALTALKMTLPVGFYGKNVSPEGCRDMVGNVWELTVSPAPGGGVVVRGGSWFDFALFAKTYHRSLARVDARNGAIGFRCVRRPMPRLELPRAVIDGELDAAIAARKYRGELPDPTGWSPNRRDLVPDLRRLRAVVAANDAEAGADLRFVGPSPARPPVRKAFAAPTPTPPPVTSPPPKPLVVAAPPSAPKPAQVVLPTPALKPVAEVAPAPTPALKPAQVAPPTPIAVPKPVAVPAPVPVQVAPPTVAKPVPVPVPAPPTDVARRALPVAPSVVPSVPAPPRPAPTTPAGPPTPVVAATPRAVAPLNPLATPPAPVAAPTTAAAAFRQAADEATRAVSAPTRVEARPAATAAETSSPVRFALLVMGLLAATVLLVTLVLNAGRGGGDEVEDDPARLQLPEVVRAHGDEAFPVVLSDGSPSPDLTLLEQGTVLLVFADVASAAGRDTAGLAGEMHRRLRAYDVRTVLVLPREVVTSDPRADSGLLKEKLSGLGVRGDVPVLLDVGDDRGGSRFRRVRWQVTDPNAAIVLQGGREIMRVSPASRGAPLLRAHLALLVKKAAHLGGLRPEEGDGDSEDEDADYDGPTALDGPARRPSAK